MTKVSRITALSSVSFKFSYRFDLADWRKYQYYINERNLSLSLNSPPNLEKTIDNLTHLIKDARDFSVPFMQHRNYIQRLALDTINAIRYKRKLTRNW